MQKVQRDIDLGCDRDEGSEHGAVEPHVRTVHINDIKGHRMTHGVVRVPYPKVGRARADSDRIRGWYLNQTNEQEDEKKDGYWQPTGTRQRKPP